ncbi:MAG: transcriptional repressor [Chloroflexota bacterium]|nr:transcriptional repressor [Anaerolineales bacterium]MCB8968008.1 transcriptional repressor [Ardenticatenaceae bacterium]
MSDQLLSLSKTLTDNGHRLTTARQVILETLVTCGGHLSADDLAAKVRDAAPRVGRMTVYRTLDLLCELGMIRPIYQGTGAAHYILMDEGSHHHLICNRCGLVIEFDECMSSEVGQALSQRFNFKIQSHLLEFHGLCDHCQKL